MALAGNASFPADANLAEVPSIHALIYNHFNDERARHIRQNLKPNRAAAFGEWRGLFTA
jgi:hypothetical protein